MIVRIRSRDGLERVTVPQPSATISDFKALIESQLQVPIHAQTLSLDQNLLLAKTPEQIRSLTICSPLSTPLHSLGITHGSVVFLYYEGERTVPPPACLTPAGSFGKKMTMDDLIAKQMRVSRQETPHCDSVSFDRTAAAVFQRYVNETLAFAVKRCGFMYGRLVDDEKKVMVDVIYEPPQQGTEREVLLMRDEEEEKKVDAIAAGFGMKKVGFIFTQAIGRGDGYTMSDRETLMAAQMQAESGIEEWVTAIVKLEVNEEGGADVHFEAFQMSDICVRLFKEGWFVTEIEEGADPKVSRMKKDVVVGVKDTKEVDNDFFLVLVKIFDHQCSLSTTFPVENRITTTTLRALKNHLDKTKNLPYVKRISDFHLLLFLAYYLDVNADIPTLASCVLGQTTIPEGYVLLIDSLANQS